MIIATGLSNSFVEMENAMRLVLLRMSALELQIDTIQVTIDGQSSTIADQASTIAELEDIVVLLQHSDNTTNQRLDIVENDVLGTTCIAPVQLFYILFSVSFCPSCYVFLIFKMLLKIPISGYPMSRKKLIH